MLDEPIPVIFRCYLNGTRNAIVAVFPTMAGTSDARSCGAYTHVGQHYAIDLWSVMASSTEALPHEYAPLAEELAQRGYHLHPVRQASRAFTLRRQGEAAAIPPIDAQGERLSGLHQEAIGFLRRSGCRCAIPIPMTERYGVKGTRLYLYCYLCTRRATYPVYRPRKSETNHDKLFEQVIREWKNKDVRLVYADAAEEAGVDMSRVELIRIQQRIAQLRQEAKATLKEWEAGKEKRTEDLAAVKQLKARAAALPGLQDFVPCGSVITGKPDIAWMGDMMVLYWPPASGVEVGVQVALEYGFAVYVTMPHLFQRPYDLYQCPLQALCLHTTPTNGALPERRPRETSRHFLERVLLDALHASF